MKRLIMMVLMICLTQSAYAENRLTVGGGGYLTSNSNYGNGYDLLARVEHEVYNGLGIALEGAYHGPKSHDMESDGTYGDMSGWSVIPELIYRPKLDWKVRPYVFGGVGYSSWTFKRSPEMAEKGISISMGSSVVKKVGIGLETQINAMWVASIEASYLQSHVPKEAYDSTGANSIVVTDEATIGEEEKAIILTISRRF